MADLSNEQLLRIIAENTGARINLSLSDLDLYMAVAREAIRHATMPPRVTPGMVDRLTESWRTLAEVQQATAAQRARLGLDRKDDDADNLSVMLWLLRRLPRAYENPPHIVQAIERIAARTGTDITDSMKERANG